MSRLLRSVRFFITARNGMEWFANGPLSDATTARWKAYSQEMYGIRVYRE
jgi:hypothetical protein